MLVIKRYRERKLSENFVLREIQQDVPLVQNETFHEVKVSVIPEPTQQPPSTPPLPAIEDLAALVINFEAVDSFLHKFHTLEKDVQEIKQADHFAAILESLRSQVPSIVKEHLGTSLPDAFQKVLKSHTEGLKKELTVTKAEYKEFIKESITNEVKNQLLKILPKAVSDFATPILYDGLVNSYLLDKDIVESYGQTVSLKRSCEDDQDEDPPARPNQGKEIKNRRTRKEAESSKKSSKSKESTKGKPPSKSSKSGKSASADQSVKEPKHEEQMEFEEPTFKNVANDVDVLQVDPKLRMPKLDWFPQPPRLETPEPDWNTVKTIDDAPK
ncbi:hypothetical protein Tco_1100323 [Tanacetum coccineum]